MYRGDSVRKRVLFFLLAASAAFCFICSSAPVVHAIVPLGLVQSALASYVTSTGYKMYNDQGTGEDIINSLSDLYNTWLNSSAGQAFSLWTLTHIAAVESVFSDQYGNIVIKQDAANVFQEFSEWIKSNYSVPDDSSVQTQVVQPSSGSYTDGTGLNCALFTSGGTAVNYRNYNWYRTASVGYDTSRSKILMAFNTVSGNSFYLTKYLTSSSEPYLGVYFPSGSDRLCIGWINTSSPPIFTYFLQTNSISSGSWHTYSISSIDNFNYFSDIPVSTVVPSGSDISGLTQVGGVLGLAVSIAGSVADVAGRIEEDDESLVVGVGAGVGATAEDIAGIVAQGVKAQTLDPSVTVVADAVIDTPVQPYPDIDGLGLPSLGAALVNRFPFCIPWDFVDTVRLLSADPQPINISVDLIPQRIKAAVGISSDTSFEIDLSGDQYAKIGVFCRWGSLITFCFGLFLLTKRLVWTA